MPAVLKPEMWPAWLGGGMWLLQSVSPHTGRDLPGKHFKPFAPALRLGQRLGFDLRANPVISVPEKPGQRGKRQDVVMHALRKVAQDERAAARGDAIREVGASWLARKAETDGFSIDPDRLYIDGYDKVRLPRDGARPIVFSTLNFQGGLTVHDPARFLAGILRGFGAAKAFGCGLMLIRPARS